MQKAILYLLAILFVIGGVFMLGWLLGDNETGAAAGWSLLYLIVQGAFFYHFFGHHDFADWYFRIRF